MSDNVDIYKRLLFRPPGLKYLMAAIVVVGAVFGTVSAFVLFRSFGLSSSLAGAAVAALFFYILPSFIAAETVSQIAGITRNMTYITSLLDQATVFLFSLMIPFADSSGEAWQVMWLGLATVYLINLLMVVVARGRKRFSLNLAYPLIYPVWLLGWFHFFIGRLIGIPSSAYLQNSVLFLLSAGLLVLAILMFEFLIRANVTGLSALDFISTLVFDEEYALDGGVETAVPHQALRVDNGDSLTFTVPWLHPGPVEGFGGGRLTAELIDADADTFFLHIPCYHSLDLADPADIDRFRAPPDVDTATEATRLLSLEHEGFQLWGRRYGDTPVVYLQNRGIDDYEPALAFELKQDHPNLCLIDLHNQPIGSDANRLQRLDSRADTLQAAVDRMVAMLEDADVHRYHAGFTHSDEYACLVEEVDGQRTCLLGIDGNDAPQVLLDMEDRLDFDETLVYTTDSHERLLELARPRQYDADTLEAAADAAEQDLAPAAAGIGERTVDGVPVLGRTYEGLITTLNVMARLVPVSLVFYYLTLIFLVL